MWESQFECVLRLSLLIIFKSSPVHKPGAGEAEREGHPNADEAPAEDESEEVAQRQGDEEIGNEGHWDERLYVGHSPKGIAVDALQGIAQLIDGEDGNYCCHQVCHLAAAGEERSDLVPKQENGQGDDECHCPGQIQTGLCHALCLGHITCPAIIAYLYCYGSCHSVVEHEAQLSHGIHDVMSCQRGRTQPTHVEGTQAKTGRLHSHLKHNGNPK